MSNVHKWKSNKKIEESMKDYPQMEKLKRLYSLWYFWDNCYIDSNYTPSPQWKDIVKLSNYGKNIVSEFLQDLNCEDEALLNFCLFKIFYYHDILISVEETNIDLIEKLLEKDLINKNIRLPFLFGRLLYDKYNDNFCDYIQERIDHILEPDVLTLLDNTPVGVYQLGKLLVGPMGLIKSDEERFIPPTLSLPLWHCSDTGCGAIHTVRMISDTSCIAILQHQIKDILYEKFNRRSEWESALNLMFFKNAKRELGQNFMDLAVLLYEGFTENEMRSFLEEALRTYGPKVLKKLILKIPNKNLLNDSPHEIVNNLDNAEVFQSLLFFSDLNLISIIENCLDHKIIQIPLGQIRKAKNIPGIVLNETEVSGFGLRPAKEKSVVALIKMLEEVYAKCGKSSDLRWRLKASTEDSTGTSLFNYLNVNGPKETVKSLILPDETICKTLKENLYLSVNPIEKTDIFINRLLWRIGFEPIDKDTMIFRLNERIDHFIDVLMQSSDSLTEHMRENIRSAGVNLFVSVEEFLESLITFNVWVLASDHFLKTKCTYNLFEARKIVSSVLGVTLKSDDQELSWDSNGKNTLSVLVRYLNESKRWMTSLIELDRDNYLRSKEDMPYYTKYEMQSFLYKHTQLWADMEATSLQTYISDFVAIIKLIGQANLSSVRNGIDHMRDESNFPQIDLMIACATRLKQASAIACTKRYFPNLLWLSKYERTRDGFIEYTLIDSKNQSYIVKGPSMYKNTGSPTFYCPWLVSPVKLSEYPNSHIIFKYKQSNEYDYYWEGYPRRVREHP